MYVKMNKIKNCFLNKTICFLSVPLRETFARKWSLHHVISSFAFGLTLIRRTIYYFPRCSALLSSVAANVPESSKRVESGFDGPQLDSDVIRFQVVHGW